MDGNDDDRDAADAWMTWAVAYRDDLDPLNHKLALPPDPAATADALKPFMRGLSPYGPESHSRHW